MSRVDKVKFVFNGYMFTVRVTLCCSVGLVTSDDAQKGQKKEKSDNLDLWSRVRHFSGSSTTSIEEQTALESPVLDR